MNITSTFQTLQQFYSQHQLENVPFWITQDYLYATLDSFAGGLFDHEIAGESTERRRIRLLTLGSGPTPVLLWTQMHGDEPTATRAMLDILTIMHNQKSSEIVDTIRNNLTLYILPMLNPDGAERFTRRTALGIDMNRDALALRTPEARILHNVIDMYDISWAYSLHDQERRYTVGGTKQPAGISVLAAARDWDLSIDEVRRDTMRLASCIAQYVRNSIPDQIGRYDDAYEPRAFGDACIARGVRSVLIESGYIPRDRHKEIIRKSTAIAILGSLYHLALDNLPSDDLYHTIPVNRRFFAEYVFKDISIKINGMPAGEQDVALHHEYNPQKTTKEVFFKLCLTELGDCKPFISSYTFDGKNLEMRFRVDPTSKSGLPETEEDVDCEIVEKVSGKPLSIQKGIPSGLPEEVFRSYLV
jgi:hypothetical protein